MSRMYGLIVLCTMALCSQRLCAQEMLLGVEELFRIADRNAEG